MKTVLSAFCLIAGAALIFAVASIGKPAYRWNLLEIRSSVPNATMTPQNPQLPPLRDPRIVIKKRERKLELFDGNELVKSYSVVLGSIPEGDKEIEGDGKTPEGEFYVFTKNPKSRFHLSLGISYPSTDDARRGLQKGLISQEELDSITAAITEKKMPLQKTKLGGEIYIHGGGTTSDWTDGCVALNNEEMEELFESILVGTQVMIVP